MGTNYYIRYNQCDCCGRYNEFHIGKSSLGWEFTFHSIRDTMVLISSFDPKNALLNNHDYLIIESFQDWKQFIEKYVIKYKTVKIYDEYKDEKSARFLFDLIKSKQGGKNHAEYVNREYSSDSQGLQYNHGDYVDDEGYSFSPEDFS